MPTEVAYAVIIHANGKLTFLLGEWDRVLRVEEERIPSTEVCNHLSVPPLLWG